MTSTQRTFFCLFTLCSLCLFADPIDLEEKIQDFVLETRKIEVPGYPLALNPCIIRWQGRIIMSFRIIPNRKNSYTTLLGLVWLDDDLCPVGEPQILLTRDPDSPIPPRGEDARLLTIDDRLYIIYDDCNSRQINKACYRMYYGEIQFDGEFFSIENLEGIFQYEGESPDIREKNWVPFDYQDTLLLAYSLVPHRIFCPIFGSPECITLATTTSLINWPWGILRGGTPGFLVDGEYLAFFHSSMDIPTVHSEGRKISHYFMGAYTFAAQSPFAITRISPEPIVGKGFYNGTIYKPFWKSVRVIFPCGYIFDDDYIWLSYGRQDHESWIVKLDKKKLFESLVPVSSAPIVKIPLESEIPH